MDRKFLAALLTLGALLGLATLTLDGPIRLATLLILGLFVVKTILAQLRKRLD